MTRLCHIYVVHLRRLTSETICSGR